MGQTQIQAHRIGARSRGAHRLRSTRMQIQSAEHVRNRHRSYQHWSSAQRCVALSSCETELHAVQKRSSRDQGKPKSCRKHMDRILHTVIKPDSSAALGVVSRRGVGALRLMHIQELWHQHAIRHQDFAVEQGARQGERCRSPLEERDSLIEAQRKLDHTLSVSAFKSVGLAADRLSVVWKMYADEQEQ